MRRLSTPQDRAFALGKAFLRAWWPRLFLADAVAVVPAVTATILLGGRADFVVWPAVFLVVAFGVQLLLLRGRLRAALEAFSWIGRSEWLRAREALGDPFPNSPKAARARVARGEIPLHSGSVDVLVAAGELDEARRVADALPADSEWQRFERAAQRDWVEWVVTGQGGLRPETEAAAAAIRDPEERLQAEGVLALAQARARYAAGGDWKEPLARVRQQIGPRADGILRHEWWRAQAIPTAVVALLFAVTYAVG